MKKRYIIRNEAGTVAHRTAQSHLRAAELFAKQHYPHPFLLVRRIEGEGQKDGTFQAYHQQEPIGYAFTVRER